MLIGTGDIRSWLNIPEGAKQSNTKFELVIQAVEKFVDNWTNRRLQAFHYKTNPDYCYLDGPGTSWLYLPQYPVSWIGTIYVDAEREWDSASAIGSADLVVYWKEGKIYSEEMGFSKGHRNINVEYIAGYGTSEAGVSSSYPLPPDLKLVILEMASEALKEGITAVHTVAPEGGEGRFVQMLGSNSYWRNTLDEYKNHAAGLAGYWQ